MVSCYEEYVPEKVQVFLNNTYDEGREVVNNVYKDINAAVVARMEKYVDDIIQLVEGFIKKMETIYNQGINIGKKK